MPFFKTFLLLCFALAGQSIQGQSFSIISFGAKGDGKTVNTNAFQKAIDACNKSGGGQVIVPKGIYIIGTVHLKSNVELVVQKGAIVRGSSRLADYESYTPAKPFAPIHKGMFFTEKAENVAITGGGTIDGNGDVFFFIDSAKKIDAEGNRYTRQKENYRKVDTGIGDGPVVPKDRPYQMFVFSNCKRIDIRDVFITSAPFWCMHFADCDAVNVTGIRLWNSLLVPNADGIDITSCTNVIVSNCDIRAGDDALVVVGYNHHFEIPGYSGLRHISENIVVSNCNLQSASSGIRIGFLDQNTVRNVQVSNCNITNSTRGIGIFLRDEGSLENITFSNIYIQTILRTGDWWGNGEPIHISAIRGKENGPLGKIKNIHFSNITCKGENGMLIYGTPETMPENISFDHVTFEFTNSKLNAVAGGNVDLRGVMGRENEIFQRDIPGLLIQYAKNISIADFTLTWSGTNQPYFTHGIEANHFQNLQIRSFQGTASPVNKDAYRIFVKDGEQFFTDNTDKVFKQNIR